MLSSRKYREFALIDRQMGEVQVEDLEELANLVLPDRIQLLTSEYQDLARHMECNAAEE